MSTLDLAYNEDQQSLSAAVRRFCTQVSGEALARNTHQAFPRAAWEQLAQLGAFAAAAPGLDDAGGAGDVCAICEALGEAAFPGPLSATYTAIQALPPREAQPLIAGSKLVALRPSRGNLLPYGPDADVLLAREGNTVRRAELNSNMEAVATLGGEHCGRATLALGEPLENSARALALGDIAAAAYLGGALQQLLSVTTEHAATRRQFGKTLGEFQAVSHPLADCALNASAALLLARNAACTFDNTTDASGALYSDAAAALLSAARAAREGAFTCHQVFGALGVTVEGPVFHFTRRIQQVISMTQNDLHATALLAELGLGDDGHDE
ncbi:MAG: acyl-CoA dehydrogenase family protein [Halioglobus sp.]